MNAPTHVHKMSDVYLPKDLALLVNNHLPLDDQKKLLVYAATREILPTDLIELVVCYLNYSEAQKVFLALHYRKENHYDPYNWRTFSTDVDETRPEWWEDIEFMHVNTHPADQMTA